MITGSFEGVSYFQGKVGIPGSNLVVYVYAVDGMLVDSGPSRFQKQVDDFCRQQDIRQIVHTHFHEDHTGNSAYLSQKYNLPLFIHPSSIPLCRKNARIPWYRYIYWGQRAGFNPTPLQTKFSSGVSEWTVINTPGHCDDHVVLLDSTGGRLFSGDLFVHRKVKVAMRPENLPLMMSSLRKLLNHDFQTVFCAHAGIIVNGKQMIQTKLDLLEDLQGQILYLYHKGKSIKEIDQEMFATTPFLTYVSGGEWSSYNLVRSMIEDVG